MEHRVLKVILEHKGLKVKLVNKEHKEQQD
jgi:hypothetical protein